MMASLSASSILLMKRLEVSIFILAGLKNKKNQIRVICTKCGVEMVRTVVSRRHDVIDMFAPSGMEHSELELREY